jgi:DNA invertase Pin-like site-specific DNA recombinase
VVHSGMTIAAYFRVSTGQQSIDQQQDAIAAAGITPDRVFTDTASGRAGSNRPGWTECMGYLREGDHLRGRRRRPARTLRPRSRHGPP